MENLELGGLVGQIRCRLVFGYPTARGFNEPVFFFEPPAPPDRFYNAFSSFGSKVSLLRDLYGSQRRGAIQHGSRPLQLADLTVNLGQNLVKSHGSSSGSC